MNLIVASIEAAVTADLLADSTFDPSTDKAKEHVSTNYIQTMAGGAANLEAALETLFFATPEGRESGRIDWQKVQKGATP